MKRQRGKSRNPGQPQRGQGSGSARPASAARHADARGGAVGERSRWSPPRHPGKPARMQGPRRSAGLEGADDASVLEALAEREAGGTAADVAEALTADRREVALTLRRLVEQGQVLESRPGRYQASGTGGEFAVTLEDGPGGSVLAVLPGQDALPVHPQFRQGARAGDVVQVTLGEDRKALVTRILRRSGREVVGPVNFLPGGPVLLCDNRREGSLPILSSFPRFADRYQAGDRVVGTVEIDASGRPGVHVTRILGAESPEIADFRHVCLTHDLPGEFPPEVTTAAAGFSEAEHTSQGREDLRGRFIITIDPATAKDFDDAISLERDAAGNLVVGVHIADVSHYVPQHGVIDAEAARRGTSIYLVNRVIPMLPEHLSNGLCSLVPQRDRYALSAFLTLDRNHRLIATRCCESIIHSRHRLTYEQAMDILVDRDAEAVASGAHPPELRRLIKDCGAVAQALRAARGRAGALNLFSVEHRFRLDVDGEPVAVDQDSSDASHQLIEELMLLANRGVAQWLIDRNLPCVFRDHDEPDPERLLRFGTLLEAYGIDSTGVSDRFGLQRLLARIEKEPKAARLVLNLLCLRAFAKATYRVDNVGHYALAFSAYCHFTSPIRRYPDLLVHRLVKHGLGLPAYRNTEVRRGYLDALAKQASWLEQRAEDAERDLQARKAARYLSHRVGATFPGVVTGANPGGLSVQILETGLEGFLPLRELKDDFYRFDPERFALIGSRSGRILGAGVELDVLVAHVDIERADVVFAFPDAVSRARGATVQTRATGTAARGPVAPPQRAPTAATAPTVNTRTPRGAPVGAIAPKRTLTVSELLDRRKARLGRPGNAKPAAKTGKSAAKPKTGKHKR